MEEVWAWRAFRNIVQTERKKHDLILAGWKEDAMAAEQLLQEQQTNQSGEALTKQEMINRRNEKRENQNKQWLNKKTVK